MIAASAGDSIEVNMVDTKGEVGCWHACNRFDDVAVVEAELLFRRSNGSSTPLVSSN